MGDVSALSAEQVYERAVHGVAQVQQKFTVLPLAPAPAPAEEEGLDSHSHSSRKASSSSKVDGGKGWGYARSSMNLLDNGHLVNYGGTLRT